MFVCLWETGGTLEFQLLTGNHGVQVATSNYGKQSEEWKFDPRPP